LIYITLLLKVMLDVVFRFGDKPASKIPGAHVPPYSLGTDA
jgi:hypothetical protein